MSQPGSARSRPNLRPDSTRSRPISPHTNWSSIEAIPTRLDLEDEEVIEIDGDDDYEAPEPVYLSEPRPELRYEGPRAPNIFTNSASGRGIPVKRVNPYYRRRGGSRRNFLGRVKPM